MRKISKLFILGICLAAIVSCDTPNSRAEDLITKFMDENMIAGDRTNEEFGRLDSTKNVTPARIERMHQKVKAIPEYKKDIQYEAGAPTPTLLYKSIKYDMTDKSGKVKKCKQTFYLDKEATRIVAFKDN